MDKKINELSVFFPFWNEEKNVSNVVGKAIPVLEKIASKWEILIVDDGSTDATYDEAEKVVERNKDKDIRIISHKPNRGYGSALKDGFTNSKYKYIIFTDGDGQFDFNEATRFLDKINNNDLVIGYRETRRDNFVRHLLMNMLKVWDLIFFGFKFKDIDCGFKMLRKEAVEKIMPLRSEGAMITTEILAKAKNKKLKIAQVPVSHFPREYGQQSGANLFVVTRAILESLTLWGDMKSGRF